MIRNIIFDMVGVVMRFDTETYLKEHGLTEEDHVILKKKVFQSPEWEMQDRGTIADEDAAEALCRRLPAYLHTAVRDFTYRRNRAILPMEGMPELIRDLKEKGYGIFLLSNTCLRWHEFWKKVPGHAYFDNTLISADVGLIKPQPEIFRMACDLFRIKAEESIFIDDRPVNAQAASREGMSAIVYSGDTAMLREQLRRIINGR